MVAVSPQPSAAQTASLPVQPGWDDWVQVAVLVPQIELKRRVEVGELLEVGRCPWAEQREKE